MTFAKIKSFLSLISGFALLAFLFHLFRSSTKTGTLPPFPKAAEKAAAEVAVKELKKEIEEVGGKTYTDAEIEKKFNK